MELFRIFGSLVIDDKEAIKTLKEADKEAKNNEKSLNQVNTKLDKIGSAMVKAFSVAAIVGFGKSAIEATATLGAMDAQFDQVFGSDNQKMLEKVTGLSDKLNIHTDRLKSSANQFGAQFKGAGMSATEALTNTEKAMSLAADSAAFYDMSLKDASSSMASLMKGNFSAGDAIGVFTNATEMGRKAQEKFGVTWQKLTEAQKQDLILQKIDETYQLNGAMGQAEREMNNWENTTGNLKATWERFLAEVGVPILDGATVALNKISEAVAWMTENLNIVIPVVAGLTTAFLAQMIVGALTSMMNAYTAAQKKAQAANEILTVKQWLLNAAMNANPLGWVATLIGVLVAAGIALYMNWDKVKATAQSLWATVKDVFGKIGSYIGKIWDNVKSLLKMPTISMTGKFSILPPSIHKVSVKWNAEGGIFNKPTIFGTHAGYQGVGEAGAEAIMPIKKLPGLLGLDKQKDVDIEAIVKSVMSNMNLQVVLDTGQVAGAITPKVDRLIGQKLSLKNRGLGNV